jgi:hypothetical protein
LLYSTRKRVVAVHKRWRRANHPALNNILPESTQHWRGSKFLHACANNVKPNMSEQRSRHGTLSGKQQRTNGSTSRASSAARQTRVIHQMNHKGKRQAIGNDMEMPVKAKNKNAT